MKVDTAALSGIKSIAISATVHRACTCCGHSNDGTWPGGACPRCRRHARKPERLGTVASWHRNPFIRLWRAIKGVCP